MSPSFLFSQKQSVHIHFLCIIKLMALSRWQTRRNMLFPQMKGQNWFSNVVLCSSSMRLILPFLCSLLLTPSSSIKQMNLAAVTRAINWPDGCVLCELSSKTAWCLCSAVFFMSLFFLIFSLHFFGKTTHAETYARAPLVYVFSFPLN